MKWPKFVCQSVALTICWLLMVVGMAFAAGCNAPVGRQLLVERDVYNGALLGIHTAHVTGVLPVAKEKSLEPYILVVQAALDAGDAAWKVGNATAAKTYLNAVVAGLSKLAEVYPPAAPKSAATATTKPA